MKTITCSILLCLFSVSIFGQSESESKTTFDFHFGIKTNYIQLFYDGELDKTNFRDYLNEIGFSVFHKVKPNWGIRSQVDFKYFNTYFDIKYDNNRLLDYVSSAKVSLSIIPEYIIHKKNTNIFLGIGPVVAQELKLKAISNSGLNVGFTTHAGINFQKGPIGFGTRWVYTYYDPNFVEFSDTPKFSTNALGFVWSINYLL
jgi:hypothetical protein